jgi:hypothetical protein|tara:strand:- start:199 stop:576 length:378 start_codon:yes stop_codon:yes gene_type:complete
MKISIARLKEIIMEEVAKAAAVEERFKPATEMPSHWQASAEPGSPARQQIQSAKCKKLAAEIGRSYEGARDRMAQYSPEEEEKRIKASEPWQANDCDTYFASLKEDLYPLTEIEESLNIEIVDDE